MHLFLAKSVLCLLPLLHSYSATPQLHFRLRGRLVRTMMASASSPGSVSDNHISNDNHSNVNDAFSASSLRTIQDIHLRSTSSDHLPVDHDTRNMCRPVPHALFAVTPPTPLREPILAAYSPSALALIGVNSVPHEQLLAQYLSGNLLLTGSRPVSHCYAGHQFGHFAGQLGDGAAILLGDSAIATTEPDHIATDNNNNNYNNRSNSNVDHHPLHWELQLKGAGKTPFSRQGDGRKVLRSSLREFVASEHLAALGIPTTRAAALVYSTTERVIRDPFYTGNAIAEPCAVVSRISPHFFRFGSLQVVAAKGPSVGDARLRDRFLRHLLLHHFPTLLNAAETDALLLADTNTNTDATANANARGVPVTHTMRERLFAEVCQRSAQLVARWQCTGFVHGVLNTDNLSLDGRTLDYGPFAFLDYYDADFTPNGSDGDGRYSYARQPAVVRWNLKQLAEALFNAPLIDENHSSDDFHSHTEQMLQTHYDEVFQKTHDTLWRRKLALSLPSDLLIDASNDDKNTAKVVNGYGRLGEVRVSDPEEAQVIQQFLRTLAATQADFSDVCQAISLFGNDYHHKVALHDNCVTTDNAGGSHTGGGGIGNKNTDNTSSQEQQLEDLLLSRLVSRSASPLSLQRLLKRRQNIHRPQFPLQQLKQLCQLLEQQPQVLCDQVFGGADVQEITSELRSQARRHALLLGKHYVDFVTDTLPGLGVDPELDTAVTTTYYAATAKNVSTSSTAEAAVVDNHMREDWQYLARLSVTDKAQRDTRLWRHWLYESYLPLLRIRRSQRSTMNTTSNTTSLLTEEVCRQQRDLCPSVTLRNWMLQQAIVAIEHQANEENNTKHKNAHPDGDDDDNGSGHQVLRDLLALVASPGPSNRLFDPALSSFFHQNSDTHHNTNNDVDDNTNTHHTTNTCSLNNENNNNNVDNNPEPQQSLGRLRLSAQAAQFLGPAPQWADSLYCTCSS